MRHSFTVREHAAMLAELRERPRRAGEHLDDVASRLRAAADRARGVRMFKRTQAPERHVVQAVLGAAGQPTCPYRHVWPTINGKPPAPWPGRRRRRRR